MRIINYAYVEHMYSLYIAYTFKITSFHKEIFEIFKHMRCIDYLVNF